MAEITVSWQMFAEIFMLIARLRAPPAPGVSGRSGQMRQTTTAEARLDQGKAASSGAVRPSDSLFWLPRVGCDRISLRRASMRPKIMPNSSEIRGMSVYTEHYHFTSCLQPEGTWKIG